MANSNKVKDPKHPLSADTLDHDHEEFARLLNQLSEAGTVDFIRLFSALHAHTEAHFAKEKALMLASKYPDINAHIAEHARILDDLRKMDEAVQRGAINQGRHFVTLVLNDWFEHHGSSMDKSLANHLRSHNPKRQAS